MELNYFVELTALSMYRKIVSSNTNESFSVQSQLILQYSGVNLVGSDIVSISIPAMDGAFLSCGSGIGLTLDPNLTFSNSVFLTGAFIPSEGFSVATAHECSCAGKNKCNNNGSFLITPATFKRNTISSSSYGDACPAALVQYVINFYI